MTWYIFGFLVAVAIFVVGFFVGGKHKERVMSAAGSIKDALSKK